MLAYLPHSSYTEMKMIPRPHPVCQNPHGFTFANVLQSLDIYKAQRPYKT